MKILITGFTGSPFFEIDIKKEAESRGHTVDFCGVSSLSVDISSDGVDLRAGDLNLEDYDLIHVGSLSSNRWPMIAALGYLNRTTGCAIIDDRLISARFDEYSGLYKYLLESENNVKLPRTIAFKKVKEIKDRFDEFDLPVIIKTNSSKLGRGVGLAHNIKDVKEFVKKALKQNPGIGFALRQLIPNDGDFRVNVVDGKAVICMKRTPKKGEYRSNIALGGTLVNVELKDAKDICKIAVKITKLLKFDIAGVDVMVHQETGVPYILEVNRAPGGLEDDVEVSGVNLAKLIVDMYEKRVK